MTNDPANDFERSLVILRHIEQARVDTFTMMYVGRGADDDYFGEKLSHVLEHIASSIEHHLDEILRLIDPELKAMAKASKAPTNGFCVVSRIDAPVDGCGSRNNSAEQN